MDSLESSMCSGKFLNRPAQLGNAVDICDPIGHGRRNLHPRRGCHPSWERCDLVLPERTGRFTWCRCWMRSNIPHRLHCHAVDLANFGQVEEVATRPPISCKCVAVYPLGSVGVTADLHVFGEFLVADGPSFRQERFDLFEHQRVALYCGRIMGLLIPNRCPYALRLHGIGQPSKAFLNLGNRALKAFVDLFSTGPGHEFLKVSRLSSDNYTVHFQKCRDTPVVTMPYRFSPEPAERYVLECGGQRRRSDPPSGDSGTH